MALREGGPPCIGYSLNKSRPWIRCVRWPNGPRSRIGSSVFVQVKGFERSLCASEPVSPLAHGLLRRTTALRKDVPAELRDRSTPGRWARPVARRRRGRICYETLRCCVVISLERFDEALGKLPEHESALRPGAKPDALATTARALGKQASKTLAALYAWHDGETPTGAVFDALCRSDVDASWDSSDGREFAVRFMTLAELERAGVTEAYFEKSTNSMWLARIEEPCVVCRLVPFLWIRGRDGDDAREPSDDDWHVAVDDVSGAVWLYEPAGEGLELVERQASSLDEWLRTRTMKLEKMARQVAAKAPAVVPIRPPAQVLLELLVEKGAIELAEGVDIAETAARLGPLLAQIPRKIAVAGAMEFFDEDESIAELFVDDDVLRRIVGQFTA